MKSSEIEDTPWPRLSTLKRVLAVSWTIRTLPRFWPPHYRPALHVNVSLVVFLDWYWEAGLSLAINVPTGKVLRAGDMWLRRTCNDPRRMRLLQVVKLARTCAQDPASCIMPFS
jgi:hypothetical protein